MATNTDVSLGGTRTWSTIGHHDWDGPDSIETTLLEALDEFGGESVDGVLYDHVDLEAAIDVLAPTNDRGATEVRFRYGPHEVRIERDGTIAVR